MSDLASKLSAFSSTEHTVERTKLSAEDKAALIKATRRDSKSHSKISKEEEPTKHNSADYFGATDLPDEDLNAILASGKTNADYTPLDFKDPIEFLAFFSENIREGRTVLHKWQVEIGEFLGQSFTAKNPLEFYLRAANGSGKDAYVLAAHAVWFCCCKVRSRWICTSSTFKQISTQTEPYIRTLCSMVNKFFNDRVLIIKRQHIVCTLTGSEILLYVSDDPDNVEGYHPFPDAVNSEMAICINEAKSVPDEIFNAMRRCTGYSVWLEVSSPGKALGHFYNKVTTARDWEEGYIPGQKLTRKITAYDCAHIPVREIEEAREELPGWLFGSVYLAEFSSIGESVIILPELLDRLIQTKLKNNQIPHLKFGSLRAGIDIAAGGDENVMYLVEGNKIVDRDIFIERDTTITAHRLYRKLKQWSQMGLLQENTWGDDGGIGRGVLDQLRELGWTVNRVMNQTPSINKQRYLNRGAELWYEGGRIIAEGYFIFDWKDDKLVKQLGSRYYTQGETSGKVALESKKKAKSKGRPSPDRADALILCLCGLTVDDFKKQMAEAPKAQKKLKSTFKDRSVLENYMDKLSYGEQTTEVVLPKRGRFMSSLLNRKRPEQFNYK